MTILALGGMPALPVCPKGFKPLLLLQKSLSDFSDTSSFSDVPAADTALMESDLMKSSLSEAMLSVILVEVDTLNLLAFQEEHRSILASCIVLGRPFRALIVGVRLTQGNALG